MCMPIILNIILIYIRLATFHVVRSRFEHSYDNFVVVSKECNIYLAGEGTEGKRPLQVSTTSKTLLAAPLEMPRLGPLVQEDSLCSIDCVLL